MSQNFCDILWFVCGGACKSVASKKTTLPKEKTLEKIGFIFTLLTDGQDNLLKINRDRQFAEDVLRQCLNEVNDTGKFDSLVYSVNEELTRKGRFAAAQAAEAQAKKVFTKSIFYFNCLVFSGRF